MQSVLLIHSKHTKEYAKIKAKEFTNSSFLEVNSPPTKEILKVKNDMDVVIGIGGGSVIDTAKIIAGNKQCIAIPTTAAGACMTPYATIWGTQKSSVTTKLPLMDVYPGQINLPSNVLQSTICDALSHAIESFWSSNATEKSQNYSEITIELLLDYYSTKNVHILINAGNFAGRAIAITKTNIVHATSYPITIQYGIDHGTACGMLLPHFIKYMRCIELPKLFKLKSIEVLIFWLQQEFTFPKIPNFNSELIAKQAMKYTKINQSIKLINRETLVSILKEAFK